MNTLEDDIDAVNAQIAELTARRAELVKQARALASDDYSADVPTNHPDGMIGIEVKHPHWHDDDYWRCEVRVFYKRHAVGSVMLSAHTRRGAIAMAHKEAARLQGSFSPAKRISSDDLDWWSR